MRISTLTKVNSLEVQRRMLANARAMVEGDQVSVIVGGKYQDDAMTAIIRPSLLGEIDARLHRNAAELRALGVELDANPT